MIDGPPSALHRPKHDRIRTMTKLSDTPSSEPPRQRLTRRMIIFPLLAIGFALGILAYQNFGHPEVDAAPNSKLPDISLQNNSGDNASSDTSLPAGCITAGLTQASFSEAEHPLDPLLKIAEDSLLEINANVKDYTATMISHVLVGEKLQPEKQLFCKIRHAHQKEDGSQASFAVYTKFLHPTAAAGQEAIWVEGKNDGKLIAHLSGMLNVKRFYLDPDGDRAMEGNRYPIRDIGVRNLVVKMLEFGQRDRQHDECDVRLTRGIKLGDRTCTLITVTHPVKRSHFDFHIAKIYIDDEWNMPIGYEGYLWPEDSKTPAEESKKKPATTSADKSDSEKRSAAGDSESKQTDAALPPLLEKYYYTDLKTNVGLTDADFDPGNKEYNYPAW